MGPAMHHAGSTYPCLAFGAADYASSVLGPRPGEVVVLQTALCHALSSLPSVCICSAMDMMKIPDL